MENPTYQNAWDAIKAVLREKFVVLKAHNIKRRKISRKSSNLSP